MQARLPAAIMESRQAAQHGLLQGMNAGRQHNMACCKE